MMKRDGGSVDSGPAAVSFCQSTFHRSTKRGKRMSNNKAAANGQAPQPEQVLRAKTDDLFLAETAVTIRSLVFTTRGNIFEIGGLLTAAKKRVGHGRFCAWLKKEFAWSESTARRFMRVYEVMSAESVTVTDLPDLEMRSLYLITAKSTPKAARDEVLKRAKNEKLNDEQVKEIVKSAKPKSKAPSTKWGDDDDEWLSPRVRNKRKRLELAASHEDNSAGLSAESDEHRRPAASVPPPAEAPAKPGEDLLTPDAILDVLVDAVNCSIADPKAAGEKLRPILEMLMKRGDPAGLRGIIGPVGLAALAVVTNSSEAVEPSTTAPVEQQAEPEAKPAMAKSDALPSITVASVPFMITTAMKAKLRGIGCADEAIAGMTPAQAHEILAAHASKANGSDAAEPPIVIAPELERRLQAEADALAASAAKPAIDHTDTDGTPAFLKRPRPPSLAA
jgi:hypothetical protein